MISSLTSSNRRFLSRLSAPFPQYSSSSSELSYFSAFARHCRLINDVTGTWAILFTSNNCQIRSTEHHNGTRTVLTKGTTYEEPQKWNEILGQNLLPDPTMPISNGNPYSRGNDLSMSYLSTKNDDIRSSHADSINMHHQQTPDIQSGKSFILFQ